MNDTNIVVLVGRCTRDAELKYSNGGMAICRFSIAVNRRKKDGDSWKDDPSFFDVVYFGKGGETITQYLVKGKQVAVEGELHQNRWEQDGQSRSKVEIYAENVQLLGGEKHEAHAEAPKPESKQRPIGRGEAYDDDFKDDVPQLKREQSDIPF